MASTPRGRSILVPHDRDRIATRSIGEDMTHAHNKHIYQAICRHLAAASLLFACAAQAQPLPPADITIAQYEANSLADTTKAYLHGVSAGLRYTFAIYNLNNMPLLYCVPPNLQFSTKDLVSMVNNEISRSPDFQADKTIEIGIVLLRAMQRSYPCPKPKPKN